MKKLSFLGVLFTFLIPVLLISCAQDYEIDQPEMPGIDAEHFDIITRLGFDSSSIIEFDDYYVVEGDIALYKSDMSDYLDEGDIATRQYRTTSVVERCKCKKYYCEIAIYWINGMGECN